jgi:hypothetical protein
MKRVGSSMIRAAIGGRRQGSGPGASQRVGVGMHPVWWMMGTWGILVMLRMLMFWGLVMARIVPALGGS